VAGWRERCQQIERKVAGWTEHQAERTQQ
jgi:hypothetical protein